MRFARLTWPWEAAGLSTGRAVTRRRRYGIECGLVVVILCFATISTFSAITAKHTASAQRPASVSYQ